MSQESGGQEKQERNRGILSILRGALCMNLEIVLSRKLNDAISGRVFYADFGTPQGNQSL